VGQATVFQPLLVQPGDGRPQGVAGGGGGGGEKERLLPFSAFHRHEGGGNPWRGGGGGETETEVIVLLSIAAVGRDSAGKVEERSGWSGQVFLIAGPERRGGTSGKGKKGKGTSRPP